MDLTAPDIRWYLSRSAKLNLPPRCPYASVSRCPRHYQSLSLLGNVGITTSLQEKIDRRLLRKWGKSDLWPVIDEQATSVMGPPADPHLFSHFCPEVAYDRFGYFAHYLARYADGIDLGVAHRKLGSTRAKSDDWRWTWSSLSPMHYSECPLYSLIAKKHLKDAYDIIELKPNFYGIGVNLKALFRKLFKRQ